MSHSRIAIRYAKSLLALAVDNQKVDEVKEDFKLVLSTLSHKDFGAMMKSPVISADKKIGVIEALFQGKVSDMSLMYMKILIGKNREPYLKEIAEEYQDMCMTYKEITQITVISASPMSQELLAELSAKLTSSISTAKNVQITNEVDPTILGGFILQYDDKRYDASVQAKLNELKNDFSKNLYIKEF
jgi:F-type H+-transporting ATPase subunit delta